VYAAIIDDLTAAIDLLPGREDMQTGRASKSAAIALLAKVYVYQEDWANAKVYLDQMPAFNYQLLDDYASLWSLENEDNNEIIFAIKYTDGTNGHVLSTDYLPYFGVTDIAPR